MTYTFYKGILISNGHNYAWINAKFYIADIS